jgi:hypothetical protein
VKSHLRQIGQPAECQAEPATIGVRYEVGPVRCGSATVGGVLGRVRRAVDQVHNQGILAASEADALHPSGRSQNNIIRPSGASDVAPADDAFKGQYYG